MTTKTRDARPARPESLGAALATQALPLVLWSLAIVAAVGPWPLVAVGTGAWWGALSLITTALLAYATALADPLAVLVCFCYWHRAVFMHCTVERHCLFDLVLCSPLWGRTVACVGEVAFVYQAARTLLRPARANAIVAAICVAETVSFIGVMKKHYLWFFFENGIWTLCAIAIAAARWRALTLRVVPVAMALFACYNILEDLPMYMRRHKAKTHLLGYNLPLLEGGLDAITCDLVTDAVTVWRPQMLWMSLNYTINPIASIALLLHQRGTARAKVP